MSAQKGLNPSQLDTWTKCISASGTIRGVAIHLTEITATLSDLQRLGPEASVALGEALISGLLIASFCKKGERINLNIQGNGLIKQALVDAYPDGKVRGYAIQNPHPVSAQDLKLEVKEEVLSSMDMEDGMVLDLIQTDRVEKTGPWGEGLMSVLRTKDLEKQQPYIGTIPLVTGFMAKDLTFYWHQSEQVPSSVGIVVKADPNTGKITAAGGFMVQALPGASDEELALIENHITQLSHSLAQEVASEQNPLILLSKIFQDQSFQILENTKLSMECNCSWDRVERALMLAGKDELVDILAGPKEAIVHCDFCTTEYRADEAKLKDLVKMIS